MTILNMAGGGGNNINVPLNGISNLTASSGDGQAVIKRTDVGDLVVNGVTVNEWSCTKLVRKTGSAPASSNDGTPVLTETLENAYSVTGYTNTGLTNGTTYYYGAFSVGTNGLETISNIATVTPSNQWQPGANTKFYYKINNNDTNSTIYDLSGNGVDQTWYGTPGYTTDATYGRVATFDGYSYTKAGSIVNLGNENTWIALIKLSDYGTIVAQCGDSSHWIQGLSTSSGDTSGWECGQGVDPTTNQISASSPVSLNIWVMLTLTLDSSGNGKLYINGVLDTTKTGMANPDYSHGENLGLSIWRTGDPQYITGQIKLIIGENRCWSPSEVSAFASEYGF